MIGLLDFPLWIEEEAPPPTIAMPRVYRRPAAPEFSRRNRSIPSIPSILAKAKKAYQAADRPAFGIAYGELTVQFQPGIAWAFSCWEFLLSTEGCRFLPRSSDEKRFCRGDYRIFTEADFRRFVYRAFKDCLQEYLKEALPVTFDWYLKQAFWSTILKGYRSLEQPADPRERVLTPYSYLRCSPYQFMNGTHQERVYSTVGKLFPLHRQVVDLYYLRFYRQEAVASTIRISPIAFRRRQLQALRTLATADPLTYVLLTQIERY